MANDHAFETLSSADEVDCNYTHVHKEGHFSSGREWDDTTSNEDSPKSKNSSATVVSEWVVSYLDDISLRLREGGWEEDDIQEIMETSPNPPSMRKLLELDTKQSALDALSRRAEILSFSLREAGWSSWDVAEVLNINFRARDHRSTTSKLDITRTRTKTRRRSRVRLISSMR